MNLREMAIKAYEEAEEKRLKEDAEYKAKQTKEASERLARLCHNAFRRVPDSVDPERQSFTVDHIEIIEGRNGWNIGLSPCEKCGGKRRSHQFAMSVRADNGDETVAYNLARLGSALTREPAEGEYHACPRSEEEDGAPIRPPQKVEYHVNSVEQRLLETLTEFLDEKIRTREE